MTLLQRNFSCRFGEIDLIMLDRECLVFIEVRYRRNASFGGALGSITTAKQQKIRKTAEFFLQKHPSPDFNACRFDVVVASGSGDNYEMQWIEDAFQ